MKKKWWIGVLVRRSDGRFAGTSVVQAHHPTPAERKMLEQFPRCDLVEVFGPFADEPMEYSFAELHKGE